ncbi:MAG: xanthine dehydrogenase family protein subunit M [Syntrophobacteraceae bacterium]|nr:xanthine dehydrogenase family protein subunit M [Syntrophobacteraceae bacterium]
MFFRALRHFEFFEPKTVAEANELLLSYGHQASVMAGGLSLIQTMKTGEKKPEAVISLQKIDSLKFIDSDNDQDLKIGALATIRSIEKSREVQKHWAVLVQTARCIGSVEVRRMGTVVGNLCDGTPASDLATILIAMGAKMRVTSSGAEREVPLENFCVGPHQTVLEEGEMVREVRVPSLGDHSFASYVNLARTKPDITKVSVGVLVKNQNGACGDVRIAVGAVAPVIVRVRKAEELLRGEKLKASTIEEAARLAQEDVVVRPITDIRSNAGYRKEMVRVLVERALTDVVDKMNGAHAH